eukprot:8350910-Karenia_brevis.AAC.1
MQETARQRREDEIGKQEAIQCKIHKNCMQTTYPAGLYRLLKRRMQKQKSREERCESKKKLQDLSRQNWVRFTPRIPALWDVNKSQLIQYGSIRLCHLVELVLCANCPHRHHHPHYHHHHHHQQ